MEAKVITYRYSQELNRSIPDKTVIVADNPVFSQNEIVSILRAALLIAPPIQVKKVK